MGNTGYKNQSVDIPEGSPLFNHRMERTNSLFPNSNDLNGCNKNENTGYFQCCAERDHYSKNVSKTKLQQLMLRGKTV